MFTHLPWLAVALCLSLDGWVVPCSADDLGPSTRRGGLVLSEIMYHPAKRSDGLKLSFVEVYNCNPWPQDLTGFGIGVNTASYQFPTNKVIGPHSFLVVASDPTGLMQAYNISNVLGALVGGLGNNQGSVSIYNPAGVAIFSTTYQDEEPWPVSADGGGHSLVLAHPSYGENDPRAWS
ncbi:MAG TPA: lamin tail domain-containing protein, partial [Candidatus Saccharimonadales bacterium]|nr:lamin tail domain-containing protein [Candidatus Saccharimonadales bacterium]